MPTHLAGKYQLGRTLGSGVSCKVKLAKNGAGDRFAIKIFSKDIDFEELMETELKILKQLSHPGIVNFVEQGSGIQENSKKGTKEV
jgi:5'-AMP-activated protein kinase, catalytic alpha subunit